MTKEESELDYKLKPVRVGILNKGGQGERIYSPKGHAITQSTHGGDKSDVRINFTCGHYIDANIKGFKEPGFNQSVRKAVSKFCDDFGLSSANKQELEDIVVSKSKTPENSLFSEEQREKWGKFFKDNAKKLQPIK